MINNSEILPLVDELTRMLGEDTLISELEGIIKKHNGIRSRTRKKGAVESCAIQVSDRLRRTGEPPARIAAEAALRHNLSQASVYRMSALLVEKGVNLKGSAVMREIKRIKKGIY